MASNVIPRIPWTVFFILEPISLFGGWVAAMVNPAAFATDQVPPSSMADPINSTIHAEVLTLQLGNLYLLMMFVGVGIIMHLKEAWALRNYLIILAVGDLGHLYGSLWGLGKEAAFDIANYNQMAWGNVVATIFLFVMRSLTLLGVFGKMKDARTVKSS